MNIEYLSTTLLNGWPQCPVRAWNDHEKRQEEGDSLEGSNPTRFGTIVHEVARLVHEAEMREEEIPDPVDLFAEIWKQHKLSDVEYWHLGRDNISDFIDRTLYERVGATVATEIRFLMDIKHGEIWLTFDRDTILGIIKRGGVPVISTIDRVDKAEDGLFEVHDYKTNVVPFTRWEVDSSLQLGLYDLAVRLIWGGDVKNVRCVYDLVRYGRQPTIFDDTQRESLRQYIIAEWEKIRAATEASLEPRLNKYCRWCEIRGQCDTYRQALRDDPQPVATEDTDHTALYEEYEDLSHRSKIIESRRDEIKDIFVTLYADNDAQPIQLEDDSEVYFSPNPRYEYDSRDLWAVLERHGALTIFRDVASVSKTGMDRMLKGRTELKEEILPLLNKKYVKPTLRRRKIGRTEEEITPE